MPANVVQAMSALAEYRANRIDQYTEGYKIGINSSGSMFEEYVKDLLTGRFYSSPQERAEAQEKEFSWLGSQNFPPDAIARGGDAFEIKKHEKPAGTIALNSSPPKDRLYSSDPMITSECRKAAGGNWESMDLFYIVGAVPPGKKVQSIYFVQGTCYAAGPEVYSMISGRLSQSVKDAITSSGLEFSETKELGRVNHADPLGRASLRVRGMWQLMGPSKAFADVAPLDKSKEFAAYAIMEAGKLDSMGGAPKGALRRDAKLRNPNNPAALMDASVLEVSW